MYMNNFKEDDQAGNTVMQAFWKSPIGQKWLKQSKEVFERLDKEKKPRAVGMLLPVNETITRLKFKGGEDDLYNG